MTYLSSEKRAELEAKKARLETLLNEAYDTYESMLGSKNKSYRFDSGEGSQSATKHTLKEMTDTIEHLEAHLDHICRRLRGGLVVNLNVRRKDGFNGGRRYPW